MTDASESSPYEQGEIESTPEGGHAMEEDEEGDSDISISVHSKEAIDEEEQHEEREKKENIG